MTEPYPTDAAVLAAVKERYAGAALASLSVLPTTPGACCGPSCCSEDAATPTSGNTGATADPITANLYDAAAVPSQGALEASLGCGNPTALTDLRPGQDVLDLGSGGGLDNPLTQAERSEAEPALERASDAELRAEQA